MADVKRLFSFWMAVPAWALLALSGTATVDQATIEASFAKARSALARGDGVAAEIALKEAQARGASKLSVAAGMGEAYLDSGKLNKAREWLGAGQFAETDIAQGLRMLARLEDREGNTAAASAALTKALQKAPRNSDLLVDLAQLRYRTGQQFASLEALRTALEVSPDNLRAIDFQALIVRDQFGPVAALDWFERGLIRAPNDGVMLGDYAATLGELGRYRQMLAVTRKMLELGVAEPRAHYLQAVLSARAGNLSLARAKLNRLGDSIRFMPAGLLLSGMLDLEGGNPKLAAETFGKLVQMQPQNEAAQLLLARSLYASGQQRAVIDRYAAWAGSEGAPTYILLLVARSHEDLGQRDLAAPLLDRAAAIRKGGLRAAFDFGNSGQAPVDRAATAIRGALNSGRPSESVAISERLLADWSGMAAAQVLAGDSRFAAGDFSQATERYAKAAQIRSDDNQLVRLVLTSAQQAKADVSARMTAAYLATHPQSVVGVRFAADYAASIGDWGRARLLLGNLAKGSGARDVRLLCDLSFAEIRAGDPAAALETAKRAQALQPASPVAAQAYAMALKARRQEPELVELLSKRVARP